MAQSGVWWGQVLLSAVNPSCLLLQQHSLALDIYSSSSGGGIGVVWAVSAPEWFAEGFLPDSFTRLEKLLQAPGTERNLLISSLLRARALVLREHRPAYGSWGVKLSSALGRDDLWTEMRRQIYGETCCANSCSSVCVNKQCVYFGCHPSTSEVNVCCFFGTLSVIVQYMLQAMECLQIVSS